MGLLRTLLALTVVFAHLPMSDGDVFVGGQNAVQLFYLISGFLICHVLRSNEGYQNAFNFYASRALRIYPAYFAVALSTLLLSPWLHPDLSGFYREAPLSVAWWPALTNLTLIGQDWVMFTAVDQGALVWSSDFRRSDLQLWHGLLIPQAWTLGVELSFYLLAPFALRSTPRLLTLLAASLALRVWLHVVGLGPHDPWRYRFFPAELSIFLLGALANRFLLPRYESWQASARSRLLPLLTTAAVLIAVLGYGLLPDDFPGRRALLFLLVLAALPALFTFQNQHRWDRRIGELSYPLYIGHMLVVWSADRIADPVTPSETVAYSLAVAGVALLFAVALNHSIVEPVERLRRRFSRRSEVAPASIAEPSARPS